MEAFSCHFSDSFVDEASPIDLQDRNEEAIEDEAKKSAAWRKKFSLMQRKSLEDSFRIQKYLTVKQRDMLAKRIELSSEQVKTWYQNRRARWRKNHIIKWQNSFWRNRLDCEWMWRTTGRWVLIQGGSDFLYYLNKSVHTNHQIIPTKLCGNPI